MLSPHEFATLMLENETPDRDDLNLADLDALLEYQLITFKKMTSGCRYCRPNEKVACDKPQAVRRVHLERT